MKQKTNQRVRNLLSHLMGNVITKLQLKFEVNRMKNEDETFPEVLKNVVLR